VSSKRTINRSEWESRYLWLSVLPFRSANYLGDKIQPDTAPPVITEVEKVSASGADRPLQIRARVHDNKSPTMPHDWRSVVLRWRTDGQTHQRSMQWYGEYLWRGMIDKPPAGDFSYEVCATDAAGNKACASP
jgi:hypothetical protein